MKPLDWLRAKTPGDLVTHTSTLDITLKCPQCGGASFKAFAKPFAHDRLTCAQCGTDLDLSVETKRVEKEVRDAIKARAGH